VQADAETIGALELEAVIALRLDADDTATTGMPAVR